MPSNKLQASVALDSDIGFVKAGQPVSSLLILFLPANLVTSQVIRIYWLGFTATLR